MTDKKDYAIELQQLLRDDPENSKCADCGQRGPRWASHNLGVFLCIRCGGMHRGLGTHLTKVKSITLDSWTAEQFASMRDHGNVKANRHYCPRPDLFPVPTSDGDMEMFLRDKYEHKRMMFPESSKSRFKIQAPTQQERDLYQVQLATLAAKGQLNAVLGVHALKLANGNVQRAAEWLQQQPAANTPEPLTFAERRKSYIDEQRRRSSVEAEQMSKVVAASTQAKMPPIADDDGFGAFVGGSVAQAQIAVSTSAKDLTAVFFGDFTSGIPPTAQFGASAQSSQYAETTVSSQFGDFGNFASPAPATHVPTATKQDIMALFSSQQQLPYQQQFSQQQLWNKQQQGWSQGQQFVQQMQPQYVAQSVPPQFGQQQQYQPQFPVVQQQGQQQQQQQQQQQSGQFQQQQAQFPPSQQLKQFQNQFF